MAMVEHKQIGQLNGPWSILLRFVLVLIPVLLPVFIAWAVWVTGKLYETNNHVKRDELNSIINNIPAPEWKSRVISLETNQIEILRSLTRIETKLELQEKK